MPLWVFMNQKYDFPYKFAYRESRNKKLIQFTSQKACFYGQNLGICEIQYFIDFRRFLYDLIKKITNRKHFGY